VKPARASVPSRSDGVDGGGVRLIVGVGVLHGDREGRVGVGVRAGDDHDRSGLS
jgi:hypothetical protein